MFCMNCGTKLPDDAKFCYKCGIQLGITQNIKKEDSKKQSNPPQSTVIKTFEFGEGLHINFYRRKKGMTQLQLASQVGISPTYMSQIECGLVRKAVSLPLLIRIADVLEVDLVVFFEL